MRRADRLFDIIQALRNAPRPLTAAALAGELEVATRTVYRDIATLQARRVPIEGAPGLGYVLRRGFDLPPLMFSIEEVEAIAVGVRMLRRTGDPSLEKAALRVLSKVQGVLPDTLGTHLAAAPFYVSAYGAEVPKALDLATIRRAIREQKKLWIAYIDERGEHTERTIWPIAVAYLVEVTLLCAWCELRGDFRHFRADRVMAIEPRDERFPVPARTLRAQWLERRLMKDRPDEPARTSRERGRFRVSGRGARRGLFPDLSAPHEAN